MACNSILQTVVILICINYIDGQYFDLFQALQPYIQTQAPQAFNFYNDFTTKRPKQRRPSNDNTRNTDNSRRLVETEKKRKQTNPPIVETNYFSTTQKTTRKTTKSPNLNSGFIQKSQNRQDSAKTANAKTKTSDSRNTNDSRNSDASIIYFEDNLKRPSNPSNSRENSSRDRPKSTTARTVKKPNQQIASSVNAWYDVNSVTRPPYDTTKAYIQSNRGNKNVYTTHNPLLNRPGVKPAVINGPPITNKPVTQRPDFNARPDLGQVDASESPQVITGPDEDSMSAVDKKRYIDIAERMCDKYKALNVKQVNAIPLVPSPQPVKVNVSSCAPTTVPLVVGGRVVTIEEFPHMALVGWLKTKNRGYSWKCGGSLLSNQYVLTAGHCAYQDRDDSVIAGPPRVVQLGSSYLNDPRATVKKVSTVIRHPKYNQPMAYYDLSILKMASTVSFSDKIKPACIGVPPHPNQPILATGWGRTEFGGSQSEELRSVSIPIWEMNECHNALGVSMKLPYGPSSDSQVCAGERRGGKDTCQGDSGGPAQIQDGCTWRVVAVTSVGRSCGAAETPAIYATVQRPFVSAVIFGNQATQNDNSNRDVQATNNNRGANQAANWNGNRDGQATSNNRGSSQAFNNNNREVQATNINRGTNQAANNWDGNRDSQATSKNRGSQAFNKNRDVQAININTGTIQATSNNRGSSQTTNNNRNNQQATSNNRDVNQANNQRNDNNNWNSNNRQSSVLNQNNNFNQQNNDFSTGFHIPSIADSSVNTNNQEKRNNWSSDKVESYNQNTQNQPKNNNNNYNTYTTEAYNYNVRPETYDFYNPVRNTGNDRRDYNYGSNNNYNYNSETYDTVAPYNNDRNVWWTR